MLDYTNAKSWAFNEAKKIIKRLNNKTPERGYIVLETGYGPSGLPHIGTFGEVARTTMVMHAFKTMTGMDAKIICFSDDLDGLRKVPSNIPNPELLEQNLYQPLTSIPDPFGLYGSYGEHNNTRLNEFLDRFGFEYEFYSSTEKYKSGIFNEMLLRVLEKYDDILNIMLPTLGEERRKTYSPFLPISKITNKVLQTKVVNRDLSKGIITYIEEDGSEVETEVTNGACKLQWKVDWAMRWAALGVDYEMAGKDLISSFDASGKICKVLGKEPPVKMVYEHFLDKNGEKISKSKGNGLTIEEWLNFSGNESLSFFMYQKPQTAKRLYFDIIPKSTDEWLRYLKDYQDQSEQDRLSNPIWHIYSKEVPYFNSSLNYSLILNLVSASHSTDEEMLWQFIKKYDDNIDEESSRILKSLLSYAIAYYNKFIKPHVNPRKPNDQEREALIQLKDALLSTNQDAMASDLQNIVYSIGKDNKFELKSWFKSLYEILLGQESGPRMGSFIKLYGIENSIELINKSIL